MSEPSPLRGERIDMSVEIPKGKKVIVKFRKGTIRAVIVGYSKKGDPRIRVFFGDHFSKARTVPKSRILMSGWYDWK